MQIGQPGRKADPEVLSRAQARDRTEGEAERPTERRKPIGMAGRQIRKYSRRRKLTGSAEGDAERVIRRRKPDAQPRSRTGSQSAAQAGGSIEGEAGRLKRETQVKRKGMTAESEARSAVQADDAAEDEAGRLDARGASRSPGRTAEREAQSAVQAGGRDEREADRLGEGASWKHSRKQIWTKGLSESRWLNPKDGHEGWLDARAESKVRWLGWQRR